MGNIIKLTKFLSIALILIIALFPLTKSHGRFMLPASRSSVWRIARFKSQNPPKNYNDNALFCGGIHQATNPGINCGVCGDPKSQPVPRANEVGGRWYKGIITGKYKTGQVIEVGVELTQAHKGFMEWRLCTDHRRESQNCFNQHLLQKADGTGSRVQVTRTGKYKTKLKLPPGVKCNHCVIQWNYRAGNNWGNCGDGTSRVGCGPQETFRGCSDVTIQ